MKHTSEYMRINNMLKDVEKGRLPIDYLDWCAHRVDWAWKWRKISREEMEELANRVTKGFEEWNRNSI